MPVKHLSTAKIARAAGCHPNTVRLYEAWGLIPPVPRSPKGYRLYTREHQEQMILARTFYNAPWAGKRIRVSGEDVIRRACSGDLPGALALARQHEQVVRSEIEYAEAAARVVQRWVDGLGVTEEVDGPSLHIRETAHRLGVSLNQLYNWERSGLINDIPRDAHNQYRLYGSAEIARLRIIRMLRNAGYSPMAILRMLTQLDEGGVEDVRAALDTPRPDEDILTAPDRWLTTLQEQVQIAQKMTANLEERINLCEESK